MRSLFIITYYLIAKKLPSSFYPLGNFFNRFRLFCLHKFCSIGNFNKVQKDVYLGNGNNIVIGNYCQINENVKLDNVTIGNYVMIAPGVTILGKMHQSSDIRIPMILQGEKKVKKTEIDDDVWIGTNSIIMPGIKIAKGCIIGAGSVLTKDTSPYGVYGGVPAKLIKSRS